MSRPPTDEERRRVQPGQRFKHVPMYDVPEKPEAEPAAPPKRARAVAIVLGVIVLGALAALAWQEFAR